MQPAVTTLVIPGEGFISAGAQLPSPGLYGIEVDGPWTAAPLSIIVSQDNLQTWLNVEADGNEIILPVSAGQRIQFDSELWEGVTAIKVRSGSAESPVPQAADTRILIIGPSGTTPVDPAEPNPRRTISAECYGYVGSFTPYWSTDDDVATFDLTFILATGERVTSIVTFDVQPEGPTGVTDPTPAARILGSPSIIGAAVSQRFGDWQAGIVQIIYRVNLICMTSFGNTISVYAFVAVNQPPSPI